MLPKADAVCPDGLHHSLFDERFIMAAKTTICLSPSAHCLHSHGNRLGNQGLVQGRSSLVVQSTPFQTMNPWPVAIPFEKISQQVGYPTVRILFGDAVLLSSFSTQSPANSLWFKWRGICFTRRSDYLDPTNRFRASFFKGTNVLVFAVYSIGK